MINIGIVSVLYNHKVEDVDNWFETLLSNFYYTPLYRITIYLVNTGTVSYDFSKFEEKDLNLSNDITFMYFETKENLGYCGGNNYPLSLISPTADFDVMFIINPDMYINNSLVFDWMYTLTKQKHAITGVLQNGVDWLVYSSMFPTDEQYDPETLPFAYDYNPKQKFPNQNWKMLPYVDGSLMCIPFDYYSKEKFDTDFHPGYFGETAFQFKAQLDYDIKLLNCPIKKMITHKSKSDEQYGYKTKETWTKSARELFYKKYVLPNYDKFLSLLV